MAWKEVSGPEVWRPQKEGDSVQGELADIREGNYGKVYDIETASGTKTVFGSAILDRLMRNVAIGQKVKIVFEGMIKTRAGRNAKQFKVFVQ